MQLSYLDCAWCQDYIEEHTAVPMSEMINSDELGGSSFVNLPGRFASALEDGSAANLTVPKFQPINGKGHESLNIVVAGGEAGKFSLFFSGWTAGPMGSFPVSEKIEV